MEDDRARFVELFQRHYGAVMRYAARRVGGERAPDVVNEAFLVAWRRLADVPVADPLPWLYATTRHVIGNEIRGRERRAGLAARLARTNRSSPTTPTSWSTGSACAAPWPRFRRATRRSCA